MGGPRASIVAARRIRGGQVWRLGICGALIGAALTVTACGKKEEESAVALAPIPACVVTRKEGKRLVGGYLRRSKAAQDYAMFSVEGKARSSGLPRNLVFDDSKIRRIRSQSDGPLKGSRKSVAKPMPGFPATGKLPAVYELSYRADKIDYTGPLVVGTSAAGFEIPTTGKKLYTGKVQLTLNAFDDSGGVTTTTAEGQFTANVGFGSGRATFTLAGLKTSAGPALPFVNLIWSNLGLCGTRVVSSGQGSIKLVAEDGTKVSPFLTGRAPTPLRSSFEAAQFAAAERPGPPDKFGGVFLIESDEGTVSAVFLTDGSP